jgi:hypothetical protein
MRVFIPKGRCDVFIHQEILNENCYSAFYGFSTLGWEVVFYEGLPPEGLSREDIVVGWISNVKLALRNLGVEPPVELDYPDSIRSYLGRKVWQTTLHTVYNDESLWPVFVKPVSGKQFTGKLITGLKDMIGLGTQEDRKIWCSDPVKFISEWRCFVRYGNLIDSKNYAGDFTVQPDFNIVRSCIESYTESPAGYTVDFGVTSSGESLLVEVNDGYSMGTYGLNPLKYARIISARWSEMVGIPDPLQMLK